MKYGYVFEVASIAVSSLFEGADTLGNCELTERQSAELFRHVADIEEAAIAFRRLARVVVAENATTTSEEISNV